MFLGICVRDRIRHNVMVGVPPFCIQWNHTNDSLFECVYLLRITLGTHQRHVSLWMDVEESPHRFSNFYFCVAQWLGGAGFGLWNNNGSVGCFLNDTYVPIVILFLHDTFGRSGDVPVHLKPHK